MGQPAGPFKIILVEYRRTASPDTLGDPNRDRLQAEVAKLFGVDDETASNILSAMPIVVLDGLDAPNAGVVRNRLQYLVQLGCRVTTTDEVSDNIPRVNWPELPPIARVDPGELHRSSSTGPTPPPTRPGTVQCPSCGAGLRVVAESGTGRHNHTSSATRQAAC